MTRGVGRAADIVGRAANQFGQLPTALAFVVMVAAVAALRAALLSYPPVLYGDSQGYLDLAGQLRTLRFAAYNGARTPVYPLFLLLSGFSSKSGFDANSIRVIQNLTGIGVAAMLFLMVYWRTKSTSLAFISGLACGLDLSQLGFEQLILTEALCTFLLTLSVLLFQWALSEEQFGWRKHALLGIATALTILTRPLYVYLVPLYLAFVALTRRRGSCERSELGWRLGAFAAPAGALLLGWCLFNWSTVGYFGITTQLGIGLTNHSGAFIELAPARYAGIRDPYLKARSKQIAETGSYVFAIFRAMAEIEAATGYDYVRLSQALTRMSLELFVEHPILYGRGVARGWLRFWDPPMWWRPVKVRLEVHGALNHAQLTWFQQHAPTAIQMVIPLFARNGWAREMKFEVRDIGPAAFIVTPAPWYESLWGIEIWTLRAANLIFLLLVGCATLRFLLRRSSEQFDLCVIAIVLSASVVQAMLDYGENDRYGAPTSPLVFYTVLVAMWQCMRFVQSYYPRSPLALPQELEGSSDGI